MAHENFNICLNLLKERYEDKQLMIHSHMSKLLKLENITDVKDVSGLRKLFETIDIQIVLPKLNVSKAVNDIILPFVIRKKAVIVVTALV